MIRTNRRRADARHLEVELLETSLYAGGKNYYHVSKPFQVKDDLALIERYLEEDNDEPGVEEPKINKGLAWLIVMFISGILWVLIGFLLIELLS